MSTFVFGKGTGRGKRVQDGRIRTKILRDESIGKNDPVRKDFVVVKIEFDGNGRRVR